MHSDGSAPSAVPGSLEDAEPISILCSVIRCLDIKVRRGRVCRYVLHLTTGSESWIVTKRYSELFRCHVLLEDMFMSLPAHLRHQELPEFPPKEPFLRKLFSKPEDQHTLAVNRRNALRSYFAELLVHPVGRWPFLLCFLHAPAMDTGLAAGDCASGAGPDGDQILALSGVRVRYTGEPGVVEVVVRASSETVQEARVVWVTQRSLEAADDEKVECKSFSEDSGDIFTNSPVRVAKLILPHTDEGEGSEAAQRFSFPLGTLWEISARLVNSTGIAGAAVTLQLRIPTLEDIAEKVKCVEAISDPDLADELPTSPREEEEQPEAEPEEQKPPQRARPGGARRLARLPERDVPERVSYRGSVAAEYAKSVHERMLSTTASSMAVSKTATEEPKPTTRRMFEDRRLKDQKERQVVDEHAIAVWLHAVTGHEGSAAAAAGRQPFASALQSGEVLCDLVDAVWPGKIGHVLRGKVMPYRRVENISRFLQACVSLGMDSSELFAPADLAEGKHLRCVVECLFNLGEIVRELPAYDGPQLQVPPNSQCRASRHRTKAVLKPRENRVWTPPLENATAGTVTDDAKFDGDRKSVV